MISKIHTELERLNLRFSSQRFTSNNPTAQSRDALYFCHIVLHEVVITLSAAHVPWQTEPVPQLAGPCDVSCYHGLRAHVKAVPHQSPVSQHADPSARIETEIQLVYCYLSLFPPPQTIILEKHVLFLLVESTFLAPHNSIQRPP